LRKRLTLLVLALVLLAGFVVAPFIVFAKAARSEIARRGLTDAEHNALKHAYAAAELYGRLRPLLGDGIASCVVLWSGETLERVEQVTKHETDVAREVYKDLRNNLYGMVAARWLKEAENISDATTRLRLIGWLAQTDALADWAEDERIPANLPNVPDIDAAIDAERADRAKLEAEFRAALDAHRNDIVKDLGIK
jgi:hypothetical protein